MVDVFHSSALNALIEESLRRNPTVDAAQAALRGALENGYAQEGCFYPNIQASFVPSRQKNVVGTHSAALASGTPNYSSCAPR